MNIPAISGRQLLKLAVVTLIWGLNWPLMKFSLRELTPLHFRAVTMTAGALLLLVWYRSRGVPMRLPLAQLVPVVLLALPNMLGWHLFSILGVQELASGRAATLGFTMPIWTVLLAAAFFSQPLTRRALLAMACAGCAVLLLVGHEMVAVAGRPLGVLWMQIAAISWALGTILMRRSQLPLATETVTVWMMLLSGAAFWLIAPALEPSPSWQFSGLMWAALAWGAAVNYGVAQVIWFGMARALPPQASSFAIMAVPLVGTGSAAFLVGEKPGLADWGAAVFIVVAIAAALLPARRPTAAALNPVQDKKSA